MRALLRALVLLACAPALVALTPPAASAAVPALGVGEQKPELFSDSRWKRLGLRDVRYVTPWDTLDDPVQLERLDRWMAAARAARARVLLGFVHSLRSERLARTLPTRRQFRRQFRRIRARYPDVRSWIVWSEANDPGALTSKRPRRAAQFFDVVASQCRGCNIVAADVLDVPGMASWIRRFRRHARHRPRIWGLHNYADANGFKTKSTRTLLGLTRGRIWFTETGGVVLRRTYRGTRVLRTYRYSPRHAARSTRHVLRLSCVSRRIRRVYLYHWQAPPVVTNWDSGFLDSKGRVRPAYHALKRWIGRGGCRGVQTS
jgi:hypothetical protein